MSDILWNNEDPITNLGIKVPRWIEQDITPCDVTAIIQGGCASGAYMPAVTYYDAANTMSEHGDDVLDFIEDALGYIEWPHDETSWSGIACHFLSMAVELWCSGVEDEIIEAIEELEDCDE